jgi:hypothetical protein
MLGEKFTGLNSGKEEDTLNYFINLVISSRLDTGVRSNSLCLDEDVNVYLAHLLRNFACPERFLAAGKYVCLYESDLVKRQEERKDLRERFYLYRHTADYILYTLGIMRGINRKLPAYKMLYRLEGDVYIGRGRAYYAEAAEYQRKLRRGRDGLSEALMKLSDHFTVYLNLLFHISEHYLGFIDRFSDGEWFHFVHKNILHKSGVDSKVYVDLMDNFLYHLSCWKRTRSAEDRDMIRILAAEIRRLNPDFHYDVEALLSARAA